MASRSRTTFKKRQKELNRQEKQRDKAARRMQRKLEKRMAASENKDADLPGEPSADGEDSPDNSASESAPGSPRSI